jgi:hypothetical protein
MTPSKGQPDASGDISADTLARVARARFRIARLGLPEWTNIIFTFIAIGGGFLCAFYFFNGIELLRTAGRWPGEYLYPPPGVNDNAPNERSRLAESPGLPTPSDMKTDLRNSGDPFSRTGGMLSLQPPNSARAATAGRTSSGGTSALPGAASPLSGLGRPAPGGNGLTQAFNRGVDELQRAAKLNARRTVVVVHDTVTRAGKRMAERTKSPSKSALKAVGSATGQTKAHVAGTRQFAANASSAASATEARVASTGRNVSGATNGPAGTRGGGFGGSGGLGGSLGSLVGERGGSGGHAGESRGQGRGR